ncbi:MAG: mechanosensitive ion channel family protein [Erysipelotrichaceae bacterium]|nr:mechanosensitive ion channel family protein [Erysipelotrichaceae bacterium]
MEEEIVEREQEEKKHGRLNTYVLSKVIINLALIVLGALLLTVFLRNVQTRSSLSKQQKNNELALSEVVTILEKNAESSAALTDIYHEGNWKCLDEIDLLLSKGMFESIIKDDDTVRSEVFATLAERAGLPYLYLLSMDGTIVISPDASMRGVSPAVRGDLTQENINHLLNWCLYADGKAVPVRVENRYGTFYFYSKPYTYNNRKYALVLGADSWALDERIASLTDASAALSRMAVINRGFLFAVNPSDNLIIYYNDGENILSGHDANAVGLSREVLADGYNGMQNILGEEYYCSSRSFSDEAVIIAAAKSDTVLSHDKYVLFWSIMGFSIVMILCLVYAVIVRNDFFRNGVQTDRVILWQNSGNPIGFDRTVFNKVLPLMLIGILAVYGITFYMQTLLEVSEGIDKSNVVLQEVTARYEESEESRQIIVDYYNSRFLSTARMLTFIIEEAPEILNQPSDHYHAVYDDSGNRQFVLDDEGNPLKSVADSAILKRLCEENRISAIYLFDEDGRTIATSTSNWFFTLSHNEEDQSYPFRKVLDGLTEYYLQTSMVNDLGEQAQFFGVAMNYYTKKDASGNTVYVSRYDFEEACAKENVSGVRSAGGITKHSSLLQIELDEQLAGSLMVTNDADYILSTNMLENGAIVMFDNSRDHLCVYSPAEASIGRSAEDLGVSAKAFSTSDYYGFVRINGVRYFSFFRYISDYYFASLIPESSMYTARNRLALITAGTCLVLIIILLLTATVSSQQEEDVYQMMAEEQDESDYGRNVFGIVLPSGRYASTTKAKARWNNESIPWSKRSPEMKLGLIVGWLAAIPIIYVVISALGLNRISDDRSVIRYILSNNWDRSFNVFALSGCVMTIAMVTIAIELFRIPVRLISALLGTRGETIGHLLLSIIKYGSAIVTLFYCLYLLGIDSANLLASAGILSLIIGLGAQSLIKDIIAGIFIVFEGEFRVGDIVTINNYRGTVIDIGLRTTKIIGPGSNVKIFNNSEISGVVNMTKENSVAAAVVGVEYGQDLDYVNEVLARELPLLKERDSRIIEGPVNLGISELGERRATLTVIAYCAEKHVHKLTRFLNEEVLQIFYRNGIRVPNQKDFVPKANPAENRQEGKQS